MAVHPWAQEFLYRAIYLIVSRYLVLFPFCFSVTKKNYDLENTYEELSHKEDLLPWAPHEEELLPSASQQLIRDIDFNQQIHFFGNLAGPTHSPT